MSSPTIPGLLESWASKIPDEVWLRQLKGGRGESSWTWSQAQQEVQAVAAALESRFGSNNNMVLLSKNRPHWVLADNAIIASGNVTVSMFTTLNQGTAQYVFEFTETAVVFLGEAESWPAIKTVIPASATIVTFPGVSIEEKHIAWHDLVSEGQGKTPSTQCQPDDRVSLVFTSGTTGLPKGVIQTHVTSLLPMQRGVNYLDLGPRPQFLSYLPLSHIAERQLVEFTSMIQGGIINFNENLTTLVDDLKYTQPVFFFGPPRVWEQFQQAVIGKFGSQQALSEALEKDQAVGGMVLASLGLDKVRYCLTAAAPTPPALIYWYEKLGLVLLEGFGQTEAMTLILSTHQHRRVGSIGKAVEGVECKLSDDGELLVKAEGCTPGYYKRPEKTNELYSGDWLHTGDKATIDEDGFITITGRVKDYFKTIQGKYIAPTPIENIFAKNPHTEQQCLLGRGYSKTAMVCVLAAAAHEVEAANVETELLKSVVEINESVEKHARIGVVIISKDPWTIENDILTPTMKIRREQVEERFGKLAEESARASAEQGEVLVRWVD